MQCLVTQNECGTDTEMVGSPCPCANCVEYTKEREARVAEMVAERLAANGGQYTRHIKPGDPQ